MYETHTHTRLCKHAVGEPEDYAQAAWDRGLSGLFVTCHNPMPDGYASHVRMDSDQFPQYVQMVRQARDGWAGRVDVRLGLEADYVPGYEDWLERQFADADFDYVLGSIHPQVSDFQARYGHLDPIELQRLHFRLLAESAETGLFDCLAHPDVVKIVHPGYWQPERIMDDIRRALDQIARTGVAMELNTSGVHKSLPEMNPFPAMLVEMRQRGIPIVIGSDAHEPRRVGELFPTALTLAESAGYESVSYFIGRKRQDQTIAALRRSLQARS